MAAPPFDPDAEMEFVRRVLRGDPDACAELDRRMTCIPRFLRYRNRVLGHPLDPDELQDVIQETYLTAYRRLPSYQPHAPLEASRRSNGSSTAGGRCAGSW